MRSYSDDLFKKGVARANDLNRKDTVRPIITRGRAHEANIDWKQLTCTSSVDLVDTETGLFWFLPGFSQVGGPDRVRP